MHTHVLVAVVTATIAAGLALEAAAPVPGQAAANVLVIGVYLWLLSRSSRVEARRLLLCAGLGFLGEVFLCLIWGLYDYRLGNLPLYVPFGHALLFVAGLRLSHLAPRWLPTLVVTSSTGAVVALVIFAGHTAELLWFGLFLAVFAVGRDRAVYSVMLMTALALEMAGTAPGAWRWAETVPYLGLACGNPPFAAGAFYCLLDLWVLSSTRLVRRLEGWRPELGHEVPQLP
ncbi:MAG: hypothetical protein AAGM22_18780 [Acidobacteriota bacterium]